MGRGIAARPRAADATRALTAFVDTNVLVRHLTGDPHEMAARATALLAGDEPLLLTDLVFAECVYVLESFYEVARAQVVVSMGAALALPCLRTVDRGLLARALEVYESDRLDFAEAYLVAQAESTGVGKIVSFATARSIVLTASFDANPERRAWGDAATFTDGEAPAEGRGPDPRVAGVTPPRG